MSTPEKFEESLRLFKEAKEVVVQRILEFLNSKSIPEMKQGLEDLDDDLLDYLCNDLAIPEEYYEICQAVNEVKIERSKKESN